MPLGARSCRSWFSGLQRSDWEALGAGRPDLEYQLKAACPQPRNWTSQGVAPGMEVGGTNQLTLGTMGKAPEGSWDLLGGTGSGVVARKEYGLGGQAVEGAAWGCSLARSKGGLCGQALEPPLIRAQHREVLPQGGVPTFPWL